MAAGWDCGVAYGFETGRGAIVWWAVHEVTLSPFMIAKYEITQAQWEKVMGVRNNQVYITDGDWPETYVSWDDLHDADGFLQRTGFVLPTEMG